MSNSWRIAAALSAVFAAGDACALDFLNHDLQLHGFAAQGWVHSSRNNIDGGSQDGGSLAFREVGLNGSWRPTGGLLISAQGASLRAGHVTTEDVPTLEYAVVDYAPLARDWGRAGVRAGKLKLPIGLYNDSRDNVFTRPALILPQSVYLETSGARSFGYFSLYGSEIYADYYLGDHALYAQAGGYFPQDLDKSANIPILRTQASGRFELDNAFIMRLMDEYAGGRLRAALSLSTSNLHYNPGAAPPFTQAGDFDFDQAVASLQYNAERYSLTSEYVWRTIKLDDLVPGPASSKTKQHPGGYWLQGTYRFTPRLSGWLRYDVQYRDSADRDGRGQALQRRLPRYYFFGRDWTLGLRHDFTPALALWAEFHQVNGVGWVNPLDNPDFNRGTAPRYWNFVALMLGYRF